MSRSYRDSGSGIGTLVLIIVAVVLVIVGIAVAIVNGTPRSTPGVVKIGENTARLPSGEEMILKRSKGKSGSDVWHITYDGDGIVTMRNSTIFGDDKRVVKLCDVGCTTTVDLGWLVSAPTFMLNSENSVDVSWPGGFLSSWTFWEAQ